MTLDDFRARLSVPLPWAVTFVAAIAVAAFSVTWISGQSPAVVVRVTILAALFAVAAVTVLAPAFGNQVVRVVVHLVGERGRRFGSGVLPVMTGTLIQVATNAGA